MRIQDPGAFILGKKVNESVALKPASMNTDTMEGDLPDETESANRELLSAISHGLRTPLNTIIGFAEMMEQELLGSIGTPQYREYASIIGRSGRGILEHFENEVSRERLKGIRSSQDYEHIIELAPDMICICENGKITRMNAAGVAMLGMWDSDTLIDRPFSDFVHDDYQTVVGENMDALVQENQLVPMKLVRGDGRTIDAEVHVLPFGNSGGESKATVILMARDVTERQRSLAIAIDREEQLRRTMDTVADGIVTMEINGLIEKANVAAERIFAYPHGALIGRNLKDLISVIGGVRDSDDLESIFDVGDGGLLREEARELEGQRQDGSKFPVEISINDMTVGGRKQFIGSFRDISNRKQQELELRRLATRDHLTGLPNRYLFEQTLDEAIAQVDLHGGSVAALNIDLNDFKNINEALGHHFGDHVLCAIGERLNECLGGVGMIAHMGGDDFFVMLANAPDMDTVETVARHICNELAKPLHVNENEIFTSCTVGIADYPGHARNRVELIQHANTATHYAKIVDTGGFVFYSPPLSERAQRRLEIERNLRRAIERDEFQLFYQPKVNLQNGEIVGCEALLRWTNETLGSVPPDEFISIAESSGSIIEIGQWVLNTACRQGASWIEAGLPQMHIGVNVSAMQFLHGDIGQSVGLALEQSDFPPKFLDIELTESILVQNPERTIEALKLMKNLGMSTSMDDFGTGYSSLSYLTKFPLDNLKVDRSFVMNLPEDRDAAALVRTIVTMAKQLGMVVVAEGIETTSQETFLSALGCEMGQGYLFGRPLPADEFAALAQSTNGN